MAREAAICAKEYSDNKCSTLNIPGTIELCASWHVCMNADLYVTKSKVVTRLVADIINDFIARLSYKTLVSTVSSVQMRYVKVLTYSNFHRFFS